MYVSYSVSLFNMFKKGFRRIANDKGFIKYYKGSKSKTGYRLAKYSYKLATNQLKCYKCNKRNRGARDLRQFNIFTAVSVVAAGVGDVAAGVVGGGAGPLV